MSLFGFAWYYVAIFLIVLTVLVFVHEWGHYWVARRCGVRVEAFAIGFGPEIWGRTDKSGTRWKFGAIPLGGYVKMFGEVDDGLASGEHDDPVKMTDEDKAVSFHHKTLWQRTAIVAAGPIANFLFAMIVVALVSAIIGTPRPLATVGEVQPESAAASAGLEPGDRITAINGTEITLFAELRDQVSASPDQPLSLTVLRGAEEFPLAVRPEAVTGEGGQVTGRLGVRIDPESLSYERQDVLTAVGSGVSYTVNTIGQIFVVLGQMFAGERSAEDLGGPLRIAQISGDVAQGGTLNLVMFMAALSINLGLINLFPIPVLDGGRLVFYAVEGVLGRPLGPRAEEYSLRFGLALILCLVVFVTWNDLRHLKVFELISGFFL